jgi:hypothetical protein
VGRVVGGSEGRLDGVVVVSGAAMAGDWPPGLSVSSLAPAASVTPTARKMTTARKRAARSGGAGPERWVTGRSRRMNSLSTRGLR